MTTFPFWLTTPGMSEKRVAHLWARLSDSEKAALTRAIVERRLP